MYCWSYSTLCIVGLTQHCVLLVLLYTVSCWSYSTLCIVGLTLHCVLLVLLCTVYCWSYSALCIVGLTLHCVLLVLLNTGYCWSYSTLCIVGLTLHCVLLVLLCTVYCWSDSTLGIVGLTLSGLGKLPLGGILLLSELYGMNKLLLEDLGTPQNSRLRPKKKGGEGGTSHFQSAAFHRLLRLKDALRYTPIPLFLCTLSSEKHPVQVAKALL